MWFKPKAALILILAGMPLVVCAPVRAEEYLSSSTSSQAKLDQSLDAQSLTDSIMPSSDHLQWKLLIEESNPICTSLLSLLKNGEGRGINFTDFPRGTSDKTPFKKARWRDLDPLKNMPLVERILSYRFYDSTDDSVSSSDQVTEARKALLDSATLAHYRQYINRGLLSIQTSKFDVDGDRLEDTVFRMGVRTEEENPENLVRGAVSLHKGDVYGWEYAINFNNSDGTHFEMPLDQDQMSGDEFAQGGENTPPMMLGNFLFKDTAIFYSLGDGAFFSLYKRPALHQTERRLVCNFAFTSGGTE